MCRELSRWLYSLASAGDVCWAKPNHAFSHCQQLGSFFFQRCGRRVGVLGSGTAPDDDTRTHPRRTQRATAFQQMAFFQGFRKARTLALHRRADRTRVRTRASGASFGPAQSVRPKARSMAPIGRRTSRFARNCANSNTPFDAFERARHIRCTTHRDAERGAMTASHALAPFRPSCPRHRHRDGECLKRHRPHEAAGGGLHVRGVAAE